MSKYSKTIYNGYTWDLNQMTYIFLKEEMCLHMKYIWMQILPRFVEVMTWY